MSARSKYGEDAAACVSVAIANWNVGDLLAPCLMSLQQTKGVTLEVIVVDNGSTDGSAEMIRRDFPWVQLIANEENRGFERATNQAIRAARGKYVLLLNSDTVVAPDTLASLVRAVDSDPRVGVAACKLVYPGGTVQKSCFRFFTLTNTLAHALFLDRIVPKWRLFNSLLLVDYDLERTHLVEWACATCWLVRREAFDKVGLLDESGICGGGDQDWCFRLRAIGLRVLYEPETSVLHYHGKSTFNYDGEGREYHRFFAMGQEIESTSRFFRKHCGLISAFLYRYGIARLGLVMELVVWMVFRLAGRRHPHAWKSSGDYARILLKLLFSSP